MLPRLLLSFLPIFLSLLESFLRALSSRPSLRMYSRASSEHKLPANELMRMNVDVVRIFHNFGVYFIYKPMYYRLMILGSWTIEYTIHKGFDYFHSSCKIISSIVSQYLGANKLGEVRNLPAQAIFLITSLSILIILATYPFASQIFKLYNASDLILEYSVDYYRIRVFGFPFTLFVTYLMKPDQNCNHYYHIDSYYHNKWNIIGLVYISLFSSKRYLNKSKTNNSNVWLKRCEII